MTLTSDLRRRLRTVGRRHRIAMEERDRAVVAAVDAGGTLREVAAEVGMAHTGVLRIVKRTAPTQRNNDEGEHHE